MNIAREPSRRTETAQAAAQQAGSRSLWSGVPAQGAERSPRLQAQGHVVDRIQNSPRMTAQRLALQQPAEAAALAPTVQRWPGIQSPNGNFNYTLGNDFTDRHTAGSKAAAEVKARALYNPEHRAGSHNAYVTVIYGALGNVAVCDDIAPSGPYHGSLSIDVDAVCMGPRGLRGADGDPGQMEDITTVIVSGYNGPGGVRKITHVSTSQ